MPATLGKDEARYREGEGTRRCANCSMYVEPNRCTLVKGPISPQGLCNYFQRSGDMRDHGQNKA